MHFIFCTHACFTFLDGGVDLVGVKTWRKHRGFPDIEELRNHMAYNFRKQLMRECVSHRRGAGFGHSWKVKKSRRAQNR